MKMKQSMPLCLTSSCSKDLKRSGILSLGQVYRSGAHKEVCPHFSAPQKYLVQTLMLPFNRSNRENGFGQGSPQRLEAIPLKIN